MEKVYITDLYIKGFQSHEDTHIEFVNGFNALVGPTGSGKSAILRDLKFVLYNELGDPSFMTRGMDSYESTVVLSNQKSITRKRTKKENIYELSAPNMETVILTGFGSNPVEDVINFHGMKPIRVAGSDQYLNIQGQHDSPFFLTDPPAKKAALIGSIAKTDVVDSAIADLSTDLSRNKSQAKDLMEKINTKNAELSEYENLELQKGDMDKCAEILSDIESAELLCLSVGDSKLPGLKATIVSKSQILKRELDIVKAEDIIDDLDDQVDKRRFVNKVLDNCTDLSKKLVKNSKILRAINDHDLGSAETKIGELSTLGEKLNQIKSSGSELKKQSEKFSQYNKILLSANDISGAERMIAELADIRKKKADLQSCSEDFDKLNSRLKKGVATMSTINKKIESIGGELRQAIEDNPICPICNSDLRGKEDDLIGE